jgi:hypothetical protein
MAPLKSPTRPSSQEQQQQQQFQQQQFQQSHFEPQQPTHRRFQANAVENLKLSAQIAQLKCELSALRSIKAENGSPIVLTCELSCVIASFSLRARARR